MTTVEGQAPSEMTSLTLGSLPDIIADALLDARSSSPHADAASTVQAVKRYLLSLQRTDARFDDLPMIREARLRLQRELPSIGSGGESASGSPVPGVIGTQTPQDSIKFEEMEVGHFPATTTANAWSMDLGRLAALRASLSSAVGAAARAASDQEIEAAIRSPPIVSTVRSASRGFVFDLDSLPLGEPMHAAVEMLLLAGREDQMNASLCAEALGKLSKIDGDDLVDSPLWQDFMGGLHRLLFRLADATAQTGAAGDNHHYEILVEVLYVYNNLIASVGQSPHQFEDVILSFLFCFIRFLQHFNWIGRNPIATEQETKEADGAARSELIEHLQSRPEMRAFLALFSAVVDAIPSAQLDPPSNRKGSDMIVVLLLSIISSPARFCGRGRGGTVQLSSVLWTLDTYKTSVPCLLRYLELHWSHASLILHAESTGFSDDCCKEVLSGVYQSSNTQGKCAEVSINGDEQDRWIFFAEILSIIGVLRTKHFAQYSTAENAVGNVNSSTFRQFIANALSIDLYQAKSTFCDALTPIWNGRGNLFSFPGGRDSESLGVEQYGCSDFESDARFLSILLDHLSTAKAPERRRYLSLCRYVGMLQLVNHSTNSNEVDISSIIKHVVASLSDWLQSHQLREWSDPIVQFAAYFLIALTPTAEVINGFDVFLETFSEVLDSISTTEFNGCVENQLSNVEYLDAEAVLLESITRCLMLEPVVENSIYSSLLLKSESRLCVLISNCIGKEFDAEYYKCLLSYIAVTLRSRRPPIPSIRPENAQLLAHFLQGVVTTPFLLDMSNGLGNSVIDALYCLKNWIDPSWLARLIIGMISSTLSAADAPRRYFLDVAVMLGFIEPLLGELFYTQHNDSSIDKEMDFELIFSPSGDHLIPDYSEDGVLSAFSLDASFCASSYGSLYIEEFLSAFINRKMSSADSEGLRMEESLLKCPDRERSARFLSWLQSRCRDVSLHGTLESEDVMNALAQSSSFGSRSFLSISWIDAAVKIFCAHEQLHKNFSFLDESSIVDQASRIVALYDDGKYANLFSFMFVPPLVFLRWLVHQFFFPVLFLDEILGLVREEAETFHFIPSPQRTPWHPSSVAAASLLVAAVDVPTMEKSCRGGGAAQSGRSLVGALRLAEASGSRLEIACRIRQTLRNTNLERTICITPK